MICENCGIRPASVQVLQQQGDRRATNYRAPATARHDRGRAGWVGPVCDAPSSAARGAGWPVRRARERQQLAAWGPRRRPAPRGRRPSHGPPARRHRDRRQRRPRRYSAPALTLVGCARAQEFRGDWGKRSTRSPRAPSAPCSSPSPRPGRARGRWGERAPVARAARRGRRERLRYCSSTARATPRR